MSAEVVLSKDWINSANVVRGTYPDRGERSEAVQIIERDPIDATSRGECIAAHDGIEPAKSELTLPGIGCVVAGCDHSLETGILCDQGPGAMAGRISTQDPDSFDISGASCFDQDLSLMQGSRSPRDMRVETALRADHDALGSLERAIMMCDDIK